MSSWMASDSAVTIDGSILKIRAHEHLRARRLPGSRSAMAAAVREALAGSAGISTAAFV